MYVKTKKPLSKYRKRTTKNNRKAPRTTVSGAVKQYYSFKSFFFNLIFFFA